ncbi:hypothetical protein BKA62DRAFT_96481 [Auriculariales sp. MPI-PUGE-AT-0066]|nr:hypothetical protein BKA62DRAFT_96481 [Auriculariales sp. MPI-PUGE-AT-0066]
MSSSAGRRTSTHFAVQRQTDALLEFETFKRKYLGINKHITKLNSTLSVRIEALNAQLSELAVENLQLRAQNIHLSGQLSREREKTRRVLNDAEAAVRVLVVFLSHAASLDQFSLNPHAPRLIPCSTLRTICATFSLGFPPAESLATNGWSPYRTRLGITLPNTC